MKLIEMSRPGTGRIMVPEAEAKAYQTRGFSRVTTEKSRAEKPEEPGASPGEVKEDVDG